MDADAGSVRVRQRSCCRERRAGEARAAAACGVRWPSGMWTRQGARVIPWAGPAVAAFVG